MNKYKIWRVFLLWTVAVFLASCAAKTSSGGGEGNQDADAARVRIMSYNIHHANPPSKPDVIDLEAIVRVIRSHDPDLVALQEVDVNTERSGSINQAEQIADKLDMHYFFGKAIDYQGGEYGVAILSKYALHETVVRRLPTKEDTKGEPRVVATARVELPNGAAIRFGSTHLDAQRNATNRQLQADEIILIAGQERLPFILAGDFNAVPDSEVMRTLWGKFKNSCQECPLTSSAQNPKRTIDYIIFRDSASRIKVQAHEVVDEKYASDHLPVVAEFSVKP